MNVFLSGYFYNNLGDDLFYHIVANRYPMHRFHTMIHADYAHTYQGLDNVTVYPQTKALRGLDKLLCKVSPKWSLYARKGKKMDASLLIGGSLFMEMHDDGSDIGRLAQMPQNYSKLFILGINFGPHKTQQYLEACKNYLASATDVCFRDCTSYQLFEELPNTRVGSDIVFGVEELCPKATEKENTCIISVMDFGVKPTVAIHKDAYLSFLKRQVLQQQQLGRQVILTSFSRGEGDENGIAELLALLPEENRRKTQTLYYNGKNWKEVCNRISAAACLVGTRFHSVVLGLCYNVPTIAISYSNKTLQILKDLGLAHAAIMPEQLATIQDDDITVIADVDTTALKDGAQKHFAQLDLLLRKG